jgi:hypothetical protein
VTVKEKVPAVCANERLDKNKPERTISDRMLFFIFQDFRDLSKEGYL